MLGQEDKKIFIVDRKKENYKKKRQSIKEYTCDEGSYGRVLRGKITWGKKIMEGKLFKWLEKRNQVMKWFGDSREKRARKLRGKAYKKRR